MIVTVETFAEGEIKTVDAETAEKTWQLLGKMHNTAEQNDCHVKSSVLIDPLDINDLFSFTDFNKHKEKLISIDQDLFNTIVKEYEHLLKQLEPFGNEPRYAVQGDISDCNLYRTKDDRIGIFDFNRCGDNSLYFDALMQAIFEARLMDYPHELSSHQEHIILSAFLKGYQKERPFTNKQKEAFSSLYALVSAFWLADIRWNENSLENCIASNDSEGIHQWMKEIYKRELFVLPFQE
ncbi:MAG: hypothetical protein IKR11_07045 [Solobacterium sp.]|nr:hypothetical protein [Solobacterium sp.]